MGLVLSIALALFGLALFVFGVFYYFALKTYLRYRAQAANSLLVPALSQCRSNWSKKERKNRAFEEPPASLLQ